MKFLLTRLIFVPLFSVSQQLPKAQVQFDREIIKEALHDKTTKQILVDKVIPDKETAIAIVEPILFRIYGKDQILGERPYIIQLIDNYWVISGTLKAPPGEDVVGGTFLIVLSAKDGRVIRLTHGK